MVFVMPLSRRALISAGLFGLAGPSPNPIDADWRAFAAGLAGSVDRPGDAGYDKGRALFSPRFDQVRPPAVVHCAEPADVVAAMAFAKRFGLPIVPRGGGHSYVGASTTAYGLVLDVRPLRAVTFDAATRTATIGGGATLRDIAAGLSPHRVTVPSGTCDTVGISGITSGGGIGPMSSAYGLTSDNVVSAELVTSDGKTRAVDAGREPELFWALRGGGGGRFGVVTSWRMRTCPARPAGRFTLVFRWADAARVLSGWLARITVAPDDAWSACLLSADRTGGLSVRVNGTVLGGDAHAEVAALSAAIGRDPVSATMDRAVAGPSAERGTHLVGSDVFAGPLPPAGVDTLLAVLRRRAAEKRPGVAKLKRMTGLPGRTAPGSTAFPWHGTHSMLQWLVDGDTVAGGYTWIDSGHHAMAPWSSGRYVNYLEPGPFDPARYHGRNRDRLAKIPLL